MSWDILPKAKLQYLLTRLKEIFDTKVDKETGKGLFSGSYNDLTNKPTIPAAQVNADWNASSGVSQILNKPSIPAAVAVKGNNEANYRTGNVNLTSANIGSLWAQSGVAISSLNDLVNLLNNSGGQRGFAVTCRIDADIGVGVTGWQRILGLSQNGPNNGNYDLGLFCLFMPAGTTESLRYAIINGKTTNNYFISQTGILVHSNNIGSYDNKVTQNNTGNDGNYYRVLYSVTADDTTRTEGARKGRLLFKPSDVTLQGNDGSQRFLLGNGYMYLAGRSTIINTTQQHLYLRSSSENDYGLYIGIQDNVWAVMPPRKDYMRLGTPNYRWNQIYSSNAAISTSDRKEKKDIEPLDESARTFIMALNPVSYKFKNGNSNRTHYGMIAQDVEDEMEALGMTALDFAGFCKDQKRDVRKVPTPYKDANGNTVFNDMQVDVPGEYTYALRYEEFIAPVIKTEQLQQEDINSLKEEVNLLKEEIALLKQRLQILEDK